MQNFPANVLEEIKKHLQEEKQKNTVQIRQLSAQDPFTNTDRISDNAASDAEANEESSHDRYSALVDEVRKRLEEINDALVRIEKGTYGFCTSCKTMIDTDRLAILPTAKLCLSCEGKKQQSIEA